MKQTTRLCLFIMKLIFVCKWNLTEPLVFLFFVFFILQIVIWPTNNFLPWMVNHLLGLFDHSWKVSSILNKIQASWKWDSEQKWTPGQIQYSIYLKTKLRIKNWKCYWKRAIRNWHLICIKSEWYLWYLPTETTKAYDALSEIYWLKQDVSY